MFSRALRARENINKKPTRAVSPKNKKRKAHIFGGFRKPPKI